MMLVERTSSKSLSPLAIQNTGTKLRPGNRCSSWRASINADAALSTAYNGPPNTPALESDAEMHLAALKWIVTLAQSRYYARLLRGSRTVAQIAELMREFDDEAETA